MWNPHCSLFCLKVPTFLEFLLSLVFSSSQICATIHQVAVDFLMRYNINNHFPCFRLPDEDRAKMDDLKSAEEYLETYLGA